MAGTTTTRTTRTHAPDTVFVTIDRRVVDYQPAGWTVSVQHLDNPLADEIRREHAAEADQRDAIVREITAEHERAGRPVVVIQPRTPASYHLPAMALRDYAAAPGGK